MSELCKKLSISHHWKQRVTTRVVYNSEFQNKKLFDCGIVNNLKKLHSKSKALYSDVVKGSNVNEKFCKKFQNTHVNRKLHKVKCTNNQTWLSTSVGKTDRGKPRFTSNVVATKEKFVLKYKTPYQGSIQKKQCVPLKEQSTVKKSNKYYQYKIDFKH